MMTFSAAEILRSCICALAYGAGASLLLIVLVICARQLGYILSLPRHALIYEGRILDLPKQGDKSGVIRNTRSVGEILTALKIILFAVGYIIFSYYALDGEIRLYTLALSLVAFFLARKLLSGLSVKLSDKLIFAIFAIPLLILRILIYPIHLILPKYRRNH